jgi:anti-repressor protein
MIHVEDSISVNMFKFDDSYDLRIIMKDGEPWFIAKDICNILNLENSRKATSILDDEEKSLFPIDINGKKQSITIVNESGLYTLILRSRKPEAKKFRNWVTSEVLPSIRKTGKYEIMLKDEKALHEYDQNDPMKVYKLLCLAADSIKKQHAQIVELEEKIEQDKPSVDLAESISRTQSLFTFGELAKILTQNGIVKNIGQNNLYKWMLLNGYIMKNRRDDTYLPKQDYAQRGYFYLRVYTTKVVGHEDRLCKTLMITAKGMKYFVHKFQELRAKKEMERQKELNLSIEDVTKGGILNA